MEKDYEVVSCTEPGLKELSKLITAQPQIENDLVYGRKGESQTKFTVGNNHNKRAPEERFGPKSPTLTTEVLGEKAEVLTRQRNRYLPANKEEMEVTAIKANTVRSARDTLLSQSVRCFCL